MWGFSSDSQLGSTNVLPVWLEIIIGIFLALIIIWVIKSFLFDFFKALFSKQVAEHATLLSKVAELYVSQTIYTGGTGSNSGVESGLAEKGIEYKFIFQLDNGKIINMLVPKAIYDVAEEEQSGTLIHKGDKFISYDGPTDGTRFINDYNNAFVGVNKKF